MVPSTTFPNPRRFPQQQEVVKSTCRCMYWFRRLKYCAPCHPVVFAFAPSSCWLRLELFFWRLHELQRRAVNLQRHSTNLRFWNFTFGDRINCSWSILLVPASSVDASGPDATSQSETTSIFFSKLLANNSSWFSNVPLVGTHHTENHVLDTLEDHEELSARGFEKS